jgi:lysophospholipid acyltransferase (LPLAT)-like uncharacterized protein
LPERVLGLLGAWIVRALGWTLRVRFEGPLPDDDRPRIYAFHHGRQLALFRHARPRRVAVLSSLSRDGRIQAGILVRLGFVVLAGSSSRGGARGLAALVRRVRAGLDAAFAVDGPHGPRGVVKPGVLLAARRTGGVVVPISTSARWAVRFRDAWDHYLLPLPFSRVVVRRGEAISVPARASADELEAARVALEGTLDGLARACDRAVGAP